MSFFCSKDEKAACSSVKNLLLLYLLSLFRAVFLFPRLCSRCAKKRHHHNSEYHGGKRKKGWFLYKKGFYFSPFALLLWHKRRRGEKRKSEEKKGSVYIACCQQISRRKREGRGQEKRRYRNPIFHAFFSLSLSLSKREKITIWRRGKKGVRFVPFRAADKILRVL